MGSKALIAKFSLLALFVSIGYNVFTFYRTEYLLDSPLIPHSTVTQIARPYIVAALISIFPFIMALVFHFRSKYIFVISTCGIALAWQIYYLHRGAY